MSIEPNLWAVQQLDNLSRRRHGGLLTENETAARARLKSANIELNEDIELVESALVEQDRIEATERRAKRWACVYP